MASLRRDTCAPVLQIRLVGCFSGGGSDWRWAVGGGTVGELRLQTALPLRVSFQISTVREGGSVM